uniref:RRM domain-containing protein n=1 Tax=Bursaphelenchus xylophilus TaxID=6326 RepID=A0A1I7SPV3_BURXY
MAMPEREKMEMPMKERMAMPQIIKEILFGYGALTSQERSRLFYVKLGNLDFNISEQDVRRFYKNFDIDIAVAFRQTNEFGQRNGQLFLGVRSRNEQMALVHYSQMRVFDNRTAK